MSEASLDDESSEGIEEGKTVHKISGFKQISSLFILGEKKIMIQHETIIELNISYFCGVTVAGNNRNVLSFE